MGERYSAICDDCGQTLVVSEGAGMTGLPVHCDRCGRGDFVLYVEVTAAYRRALRGEPHPFPRASNARRAMVRAEGLRSFGIHAGEEWEYFEATGAGKCRCGGVYRPEASARCPACGSTALTPDPNGIVTTYD